MKLSDVERELEHEIAKYKHDWLGFTQFAYPWGDPKGPLAAFTGPQMWQAEQLIAYSVALANERQKGQFATASGKGIGKSALVAQTSLAGLCTFPETRVRLTAGTEPQLRTTTMPEISKWFEMLICKHWFKKTATAIYASDAGLEGTWRLDAIPWNETNPEAFAGLHNYGKRIVLIMDEASQIADNIWETSDGVMSDASTEVLWGVYGNPTRGVGRFHRCFGDLRHRWNARQIDSRNVLITDKTSIQELIDDYGEDSDYVRMMVRGVFPRASSMQFISSEVAAEARKREASCNLDDALLIGVDTARFGDDQTVIAFRKGRDARTIPWIKMRQADTNQIVGAVAERAERLHADAIFVDAGGPNAGGVIDRLRYLRFQVYEIVFGASADRSQSEFDANRYGNKRSEMWGYMKAWLPGGAIPDDAELENDLTGIFYSFRENKGSTEIILEKKEHMKKRGLASPDNADALALTFAYPIIPRAWSGGPHAVGRQLRKALTEYDPFNFGDTVEPARQTELA